MSGGLAGGGSDYGSGGNNPWSSDGSGNGNEEQKYKDYLYNIAKTNVDALNNKFNNGMDLYNTSDEQSRRLWQAQTEQNKRDVGEDWFAQTKKLQSTVDQNKDAAGSGMSGSTLLDYLDTLKSANEDIGSTSLNTLRQNQDTLNNDLYEALSNSVNGRNELAADTEYGLNTIKTDLWAQLMPYNKGNWDEAYNTGESASWGNGFYNGHKVGPAEITKQGFYREDNAGKNAYNINNAANQKAGAGAAANTDYWTKLFNGYNRRF